ncbi:MAG TPA: SprT family zinc-dependent metalloprotease [Bacteroidales bacterium]|nr:SprT family zinc-dependent metalloprotease [Bacteroidales bacterium]HRU33572.1 SprT family zinc-dependent metalloprotease [Candidatus Paceibacterota bacterium]
MSTNYYLQIGSVKALVVRKPIKNVHLSVLPPNGWVRVTAPINMKDDAIRTLLSLRLPWIKKQQAKFAGQERQTKRDYSSGESHYFLGKRYRLEVVYKDEAPKVFLKGKTKIVLQVRPESPVDKRREILMNWYRQELRIIVNYLIAKWQKKMGVTLQFWGIKQMKTRWGTCNHKRARILINLELAKKPIACIEYVVVHELLHLVEKKHNDKFVALMTKYLPKWKSIKEELNSSILSYEEWKY